MHRVLARSLLAYGLAAICIACSSAQSSNGANDGDASQNAGTADSGSEAGTTASRDAAGVTDAGSDANPDPGSDAGTGDASHPADGAAGTTKRLHFVANPGVPNSAGALPLGFDLIECDGYTPKTASDQLDALPAGVKGLVFMHDATDGSLGATAEFKAVVDAVAGSPKLYGFYIADEPRTNDLTAQFTEASDYIHTRSPGAISFIVLNGSGSEQHPTLSNYTPENSHVDLFGLDPYPVQSTLPGGYDLSVLDGYVSAALAVGIPKERLVPVYQAFGTYPTESYVLPTAAQEQEILAKFDALLPNPAFDYAYSWGSSYGKDLANSPELQSIFVQRNAL